MTALRPIRKGEEVLNYYGPLPNSDLLRRYGYTTVKHRMHDVTEVNWGLVLEAAKKVFRLDDKTSKTGEGLGSNLLQSTKLALQLDDEGSKAAVKIPSRPTCSIFSKEPLTPRAARAPE